MNALRREAGAYRGRRVKSVYVGGGTPSLLDRSEIAELVEIIREMFSVDDDAEWTLEANPESLDAEKAAHCLDIGFNRISVGVQTFNDEHLNFLGRNHSSSDAKRVLADLREAGCPNISCDLMFGLPGQRQSDTEEDIRQLIRLPVDHISLYDLSVESGSRFYARRLALKEGDDRARHYQMICDRLKAEGFLQYEISNFCMPGKESRHNRIYWTCGHYIGLGLAAHSHIEGRRFWNTSRLMTYLQRIKEKGTAVEGEEQLSAGERLTEAVVFGLRMNAGIDIPSLEERFGNGLTERQHEAVKDFIREGFLSSQGDRVCLTDKGRLVLDELCVRIL